MKLFGNYSRKISLFSLRLDSIFFSNEILFKLAFIIISFNRPWALAMKVVTTILHLDKFD